MVKKKTKSGRKLKKRRSWLDEDVKVYTGLPPQVDGQLRCYLKISISQILWMVPNPPVETIVQLQWWGESGDGTFYKPMDVKQGAKGNCKTTARYPIRSGPKQFAAYLHDMGSLALNVLSGPLMVVVGSCQVGQIGLLAPNRPINGFFPVMSADADKVAELQVSIVLESLMASYDSMSSVPTPDMSVDMLHRTPDTLTGNPPRVPPAPASKTHYTAGEDPFKSPVAHKSGRSTPRGVDAQVLSSGVGRGATAPPPYSPMRNNYHSPASISHADPSRAPYPAPYVGSGNPASSTSYPITPSGVTSGGRPVPTQVEDTLRSSQASTLRGIGSIESDPMTSARDVSKASSDRKSSLKSVSNSKESNSKTSDLLTMILDKGNKLREAMIVSTLGSPKMKMTGDTDLDVAPAELFSPLKRENSTGDLFRELLHFKGSAENADMDVSDFEGRAVDLVVGSEVTDQQFKLLKAFDGSPGSSISGDDPAMNSDLGDPVHDDSLLQELFYKGESEDSDVCLSDMENSPVLKHAHSHTSLGSLEDPGNQRPPSRQSSCSSLLDQEPVRERDADRTERQRQRQHQQGKKLKARSRSRSTEDKKKGRGVKQKSGSREQRRKSPASRGHDAGSDSDVMSVSRMSETSRVSFDPAPSDSEDFHTAGKRRKSRDSLVDGLSVERLTLLGRVHVARVVVSDLVLPEDFVPPSTPKGGKSAKGKGKPPRPSPKPKKNCTYFVEYQFPVVATSRDKHQPNAMATEVMRVASKKVNDGVVSFNHRSVFPVLFDGDAIEKWWRSALVFKLYSKTPGQKVPRLLGMCSLSLKGVVKAEALWVERVLDVKDRSGQTGGATSARSNSDASTPRSRSSDNDWPLVGNLKVCVELASDHKDFSTALAKTRLAEMANPRIIAIPSSPRPKQTLPSHPPADPESRRHRSSSHSEKAVTVMATQTEPRTANIDSLPMAPPPDPRPLQVPQMQAHVPQGILDPSADLHECLTLHTVLMIPEGASISLQGTPSLRHGERSPSQPPKPTTGFTGRDLATRNVYLVCRMFWCDDVSRSDVCWGTCDPHFGFMQVAPMMLTASLLERLRNNFMVIEVWDKKTSAESDQLVGMVKLPLHQFYMSYRDRKVAGALLRSQYPVVSVDSEMPVVNPFNGTQYGKLKVVLAMGSTEQVSSLQRMKTDPGSAMAVPERPGHYLERQQVYADDRSAQDYGPADNLLEHVFEVSVEGIKGLKLLDNMIWGEADCFVQYHFPVQTHSKQEGGPKILHAAPSLKTFRTATTLCVPDLVFNDVLRHRLMLHEGTPVQREILTACAGVGGGAGGIPFEIWCRHYYPNVRDQAIAKGLLPLAKLCAMVTMQKRGEPNVQTYTLPLTSLVPETAEPNDPEITAKMPESGFLEVTINYKSHLLKGESESRADAIGRSMPGATVCISVGVIRASGLKASSLALARHDAGMQYASEVGVNSYTRVKLSFLPKEDERLTRTVARSFAPDFSYYMDFPCPLLWTEPGSDVLSLAEILENAEAVFELWHQVPGAGFDLDKHYQYTGSGEVSGRRLVPLTGDVLLGTVAVPLIQLLTRKTGVTGWYAVNLPSVGWDTAAQEDGSQAAVLHGNRGLERVVGGLELSIKLAHHEDLGKVVHAARGVGWAPDFDVEHRDWDSADECVDQYQQISLAVDVVCFPAHNALIAGQTKMDAAALGYVRYKFYDKGAVCSKLGRLERNDEGYVTCELQHNKTLIVAGSSPFSWYLREERLEVQVWVTYHGEDGATKRPRNRDKMIGSAYLDLSSLADSRRRQHRISDLYPLVKPGASSLGGACLRAHVSLKPYSGGVPESEEEEDFSVPGHRPSKAGSPRKAAETGRVTGEERSSFHVDLETTFPVHISVERAMHLPKVNEDGVLVAPNAYVSYQTADQTDITCTDIFAKSDTPLWNHIHDTRLDKDLLTQGTKNLVFKVWHKPKDVGQMPDKGVDKVLGFVSVDLSPLTTGFQQLCGWYNIMDFNGSCQGQIKVSITPPQPLIGLKRADSANTQQMNMSSSLFAAFPGGGVMGGWYPEGPAQGQAPPGARLSHFTQHFESVKQHHHQLKQRMQEMGTDDPSSASRSILFNSLRSNLEDLDSITARLKQRLLLPTDVPAGMEDDPALAMFRDGQELGFTPMSSAPSTMPKSTTTVDGGLSTDLFTTAEQTTRQDGDYYLGADDGMSTVPKTTATTGFGDYTTEMLTTVSTLGDRNLLSSGTLADVSGLESTGNSRVGGLNARETRSDRYLYSDGRKTGVTFADTDDWENDQSAFTKTLQNAHHLLQAINGHGDTLSASNTGESNMSESLPRNLNADSFLSMTEANQRGYGPEESRGPSGAEVGMDGEGHAGDWRPQDDATWEEEDTLAKAWEARHSNLGSDISEFEAEGEESLVVPRPLNDVSSANFSNTLDEMYQNELALQTGNPVGDSGGTGTADKSVDFDQLATDTQNTFMVGSEHSSTARSEDQRADLEVDDRLAEDAARRVDENDGDGENDATESGTISASEADNGLDENPTVPKHVSRTSLDTKDRSRSHKVKSSHKAAMYRRELARHRSGSYSSDEEEAEANSGRASGKRHGAPHVVASDPDTFFEDTNTQNSLLQKVEDFSMSDDSDQAGTTSGQGHGPASQNSTSTYARSGGHGYLNNDDELTHDLAQQGTGSTLGPEGDFLQTASTDGRPVDTEAADDNASDDYSDKNLTGARDTTERRWHNSSSASHASGRSNPSHHGLSSHGGPSSAPVPNFFLPAQDLEQTMRTLRTTTMTNTAGVSEDAERTLGKVAATKEFADKLASSGSSNTSGQSHSRLAAAFSTKSRPQPSAEQAQRIARIFAKKFSQ